MLIGAVALRGLVLLSSRSLQNREIRLPCFFTVLLTNMVARPQSI